MKAHDRVTRYLKVQSLIISRMKNSFYYFWMIIKTVQVILIHVLISKISLSLINYNHTNLYVKFIGSSMLIFFFLNVVNYKTKNTHCNRFMRMTTKNNLCNMTELSFNVICIMGDVSKHIIYYIKKMKNWFAGNCTLYDITINLVKIYWKLIININLLDIYFV